MEELADELYRCFGFGPLGWIRERNNGGSRPTVSVGKKQTLPTTQRLESIPSLQELGWMEKES